MSEIKVMSVFGTRPEAIKMAPLVKTLEKTQGIKSIVCVTAQHRDMLDQVLSVFNLTPDYDLNIMQAGQTLTDITTKAMRGLEEVIVKEQPNLILVHGDTSTAFASALSAFYHRAAVGHVEAGLRTNNKYEPYPEEINRKLISSLADLNFAPTTQSRLNLRKENIEEAGIFVTGNTVIDAIGTTVKPNYVFANDSLNKIDYGKKIIVVTAHRRENLGTPLENICTAIRRIVEDFADVSVVYAVHKNPKVQEVAHRIFEGVERVHLLDPLDFNDMHNLISRSCFVMTDSGGLQEEAPSMNKPVLVLRNVTERPEGIATGALKLAGTEEADVYALAKELLTDDEKYNAMANAANPFGDGLASERIRDAILYHFGMTNEKPADFEV